jgi:alpha,alpha-trehalose-phosphate synthase [UDP-forming]
MPELDRHLAGRTLIVLSNREPYEHVAGPDGVEVRRPAGGLVSALDPTMRRTRGVWVAWGSGSADRDTCDADGRLRVPPEEPAYVLRRVFLDEADLDGFYLGFSNAVLWPLCHMLVQFLEFREGHWASYQAVNRTFAEAAVDEARRCAEAAGRPLLWVQDYHFALAPRYARELEPGLFVHQFWHIPFPPPDLLALLPHSAARELLLGMLGNDLLEFHTERYAQNFLDCVARFLADEVEVDVEQRTVAAAGRETHVGAFPISIDVELYESLARAPEAERLAAELRARYACATCRLGVCVDRVDYTKGIPERLRALETLWETSPELRGRFTVYFVAVPSRSAIPAYARLERDILEAVARINDRFGSRTWQPIVLVHDNLDAASLAAIYRAGDLCLVSSLQDGMNLVAKEYVACQVDERGVLLLSRFAGAAEEIEGAVLINPFNVDGVAECIRVALDMPEAERRERMHAMRERLRGATIFDWLDAILGRAVELIDAPAGAGEPSA